MSDKWRKQVSVEKKYKIRAIIYSIGIEFDGRIRRVNSVWKKNQVENDEDCSQNELSLAD